MGKRLGLDEKTNYRITVKGVLREDWQDWFNGMIITVRGNVTTLEGAVSDQPALFGLLNKVRDLGLVVLSVERTGVNGSSGQHNGI
jgi:hypothetical protein